MAETLSEKLKRLAAEKKAKAVSSISSAQPIAPVTTPVILERDNGHDAEANQQRLAGTVDTSSGETGDQVETGDELLASTGEGTGQELQQLVPVEDDGVPVPTGVVAVSARLSCHPLAMEFAELESMLLSKDPQFKTILRQIHRHLGQDPELVTQMSEAEIQTIVTGLVVFANAEIVEPAKAKTVKAAVAQAKKKVISADDL